jgi:hypothetical protein
MTVGDGQDPASQTVNAGGTGHDAVLPLKRGVMGDSGWSGRIARRLRAASASSVVAHVR